MAGYGSNKKPPTLSGLLHHGKSQPHSLRQQTGRGGGAVTASSSSQKNPSNQASALRAEHLLRLATWVSATIPPLGALVGARLGCLCEAAGVSVPDTPHSICERCESIMQVGVNCSVRVTKITGKSSNAGNVSNFVTCICHFCKHGKSKLGTAKNHLKTKISQVAARSNLEALVKSSAAEIPSVEQKTSSWDPTKKRSSGQEDPKSVDLRINKRLFDRMKKYQQGSAEQEDPKYVEIRIDNGPDKNQQGSAEQEGRKSVEMSLNMEDG